MSNCMRTWSLRILRQSLRLALSALDLLAVAASAAFKSRAALQVENLALRHQLGVLHRSTADASSASHDSSPGVAVRSSRASGSPPACADGSTTAACPAARPSVATAAETAPPTAAARVQLLLFLGGVVGA